MELLTWFVNTWQFNAVIAIICSVFYVQTYKLAIRNTRREATATIILEALGALGALLFVPLFTFRFSVTPKILLLFVFANIFYTLNDRLKTISRKHLDVSVFSIIDQLYNVFLILYGVVLFHNPIILTKFIGGALIIFGNILLFYHKGKLAIDKYVLLSILAALLLATALIIDVDISRQSNLPFYVMLTLIIPAIINFVSTRCSITNILEEFNSKNKRYFIICGLISGPMIICTIRSLQLGQVAFVAPLLATSVILNVLIASAVHKENKQLLKKIAIALVIIIGVYLTVSP